MIHLLRKVHEILGTDLPIFEQKEEDLYFLEEIEAMRLNLDSVIEAGYLQVKKDDQIFFEKVYRIKE